MLNSLSVRSDDLFLRNSFQTEGKWNIPLVKKQDVPSVNCNVSLIACSETRNNDCEPYTKCGVHFFVDDYRFSGIYNNPQRSLAKYSQYAFLLTPDHSTFAEINMWKQIEAVGKNRWCGAYWQSQGLTLIPTISWSTSQSFSFCFDGVEPNATVAIGMIGCKHGRRGFLRGYDAMLERLNPHSIICYGKPFPEMRGNLIVVDYCTRKRVMK